MEADSIVVSVVVPTRNRVQWLRRCLDGIAEQTYTAYEVIIVDDGSASDVITSYEKMLLEFGVRFRLVRANIDERRRLGPSVTRNIGITQAKGTYIAFCDDDDHWCEADLLAIAATALISADADLHFSDQRIMRGGQTVAKSSFTRVTKSLREEQRLDDQPVYRVSPKQMLSFPDYAHLNITIARKSLLDDIGGFWEETRYAEDVDLFIRLCSAAKKIHFRPEVCSVHNSPMQHDMESASKNVEKIDRRLLEGSVYWHILATCKSPEAIKYASLSLASNTKQLTTDLLLVESPRSAAILARIAFAAKPSFKWGLYCLWLSIRAGYRK